ncbi:MAG: adenylate/guanylate cyclase domain-containing protein [Pseudomonadota bacterium]
MIDTQAHIDWILGPGRMGGLQTIVDGLGARLCADGVPTMRVRISFRTTHPLTAALTVIWEANAEPIKAFTVPHGLETRSDYAGSPLAAIAITGRPFRRSLTEKLGEADHVSLHEIQYRGGTDYYGLPLDFVTGHRGMVVFVCDAADGFSDAQISGLTQIAAVLAPIVEARANHQLATAIATSYLGQRTGLRVLDGQITRGDIETVEAAILFSDMRGWTALNATRPATEALKIANSYFEVISDAVDAQGGEILKFMGDGVLALFPSDGTQQGQITACRQAVAASHAAQGIATLAELPVPFGIGIHYGAVLYGNVGARARIDFTVLGQSVNIAARVEACCARLNQRVLVSDTVAQTLGTGMTHVSTEPLKGVNAPMALHTPLAGDAPQAG